MTTGFQRLLKTPKPKSEESFTGYLLRLAEENGYDSPTWIMNLIEPSRDCIIPRYSFTSASSNTFQLLTQLIGCASSELAPIIYEPIGKRTDSSYLFFGNPVHRSFIRPQKPKICPECLRDEVYCRRVWEYVLITVCPIHRCMLIEECPRCKQTIKWRRRRVCRCPCGYDWREVRLSTVQEYELNLARIIYRLCRLDHGENKSHMPRENPTTRLSLQEITLAVVFMAGQCRGFSLTIGLPLLYKGEIKELHKLFNEASHIFDDWPNNFYDFLRWWRKQKRISTSGYQRRQSILYKDFGKLYMGLYHTLPASRFDFIRNAFVDYLVKDWEGCGLLSFVHKKDCGEDSSVKYVSKSDAQRLLGANNEGINYFIRRGSLKTKIRSKGMKRLIFVDVADIAKLMWESS